jgi:hypothetical protein
MKSLYLKENVNELFEPEISYLISQHGYEVFGFYKRFRLFLYSRDGECDIKDEIIASSLYLTKDRFLENLEILIKLGLVENNEISGYSIPEVTNQIKEQKLRIEQARLNGHKGQNAKKEKRNNKPPLSHP